jgi:3-oxoadipate enol-lactonase
MSTTVTDLKLSINNINVSYTEDGSPDAPAIVFIHGFPFNKNMWTEQIHALQENFRVITYDVRGHGESESGDTAFSIDLFVDDLISLLDALKIEKTIICGLSMGGYIALRAIEKHPERVQALILSDTQCGADSPEGIEKRMLAIENIKVNGLEQYAEASVLNLFAPASLQKKGKEVIAIRDTILNTSATSIIKTLQALANRKETCTTLNQIKVPVLIIVGREDKITPIATARFMNDKIRHSIMVVLNDAGHLPNLENPSDFNYQIKQFLYPFSKKSHFS